MGLMIAARAEPVVQAVRGVCLRGAPEGAASVLFSSQRARAAEAAFINATAAHAFAMDDVAWGCHPSAMIFPALLATAEERGAGGAVLLRSWVVGYEVLAELASREPDSLHPTGWHPSALLGPIAVAAAVCNLRGMDAEQCCRALGLAASMGGGLSVNFGTQAKAVQVGRIAQSALLAVDLAEQGVTASVDALERPGTGFLNTISPAKRVDTSRPVLLANGKLRLLDAGLGIKKYPLCYSVHRIADAAIDLSRQPGWRPEDVVRIEVDIGRRQAAMAQHGQPATALEAKYSVPFAVASGLLASAAGFAQLDPAFLASDAVRRLIAATHVRLLDDVSADDPVFSRADRVRVTLADGSVRDSGEVRYARGHARLPIAAAQLRSKFMDCVVSAGLHGASAVYEQLQDLASMRDVADIARLVQAHEGAATPEAVPFQDSSILPDRAHA
jgi:2-methylcitrate dehydratase PrpD